MDIIKVLTENNHIDCLICKRTANSRFSMCILIVNSICSMCILDLTYGYHFSVYWIYVTLFKCDQIRGVAVWYTYTHVFRNLCACCFETIPFRKILNLLTHWLFSPVLFYSLSSKVYRVSFIAWNRSMKEVQVRVRF